MTDFWYAMQAWEDNHICTSHFVGCTTMNEIMNKWKDFKEEHKDVWKLKLYLQLDEQFNYPAERS